MHAEIDIHGVYVPTLVLLAVVALGVQLAIRRVLAWTGIYSFVWHRGLFDLALYVLLLGALSALQTSFLP